MYNENEIYDKATHKLNFFLNFYTECNFIVILFYRKLLYNSVVRKLI